MSDENVIRGEKNYFRKTIRIVSFCAFLFIVVFLIPFFYIVGYGSAFNSKYSYAGFCLFVFNMFLGVYCRCHNDSKRSYIS